MVFSGPASCTQTDSNWLLPSHVTNMRNRPLAGTDFSSARKRRNSFDSCLNAGSSASSAVSACQPTTSSAPVAKTLASATPSASEIDDFYLKLSQCGHKPALLSLVSPYSQSYFTDVSVNLRPLTSLFKKENITFTLAELQTMSEAVDLSISENDIELIEMNTRGQSKNKNWFLYRTGRITASKFKDVCSTNASKPSVSLLKGICHPIVCALKSAPTEWGIAHEQAALRKYEQSYDHIDMSVEQCGLIINSDCPFMGASPDALVSCKCCGKGVVEIKCPYNFRYNDVMDYVISSDSCLTGHDSQLTKEHRYYYQVQAQMYICDVKFCDLVICTFPSGVPCIFVTRVKRDSEFWDKHVQEASTFFQACVLPELLGKAYTRPIST